MDLDPAKPGHFWPQGRLRSQLSPPILAYEGDGEFPMTCLADQSNRMFDESVNQHNLSPEQAESKLLSLPNEILSHIFVFLDSQPPSSYNIIEHPSTAWTASKTHPLKDVSILSQRLRLLVLPQLFRHSRLDPYHLTQFLDFVKCHDLTSWITSVVAHLQGPCGHIHPAWWCRLLNSIPVTRFSIGCAPHVFAEIAKININCTDSWSFRMPYHFLSLEQTPEAAHTHISYTHLPNIFVARPWHSLTVNEGSSLAAYTQYEYFLKKPPSLLAALQSPLSAIGLTNLQTQDLPATAPYYLSIIPQPWNTASNSVAGSRQSSPSIDSMYTTVELFSRLSTFSFIAIFPFYNHVDSILKCVRLMRQLRTLFIKLCPEPSSSILDDEIRWSKNHIDLNDPWNEFNTAYNLISHTVNFLTVQGQLEKVRVDDVKMEGIRDGLEESLGRRLHESWRYDGNGIWRRRVDGPGEGPGAATGASTSSG